MKVKSSEVKVNTGKGEDKWRWENVKEKWRWWREVKVKKSSFFPRRKMLNFKEDEYPLLENLTDDAKH